MTAKNCLTKIQFFVSIEFVILALITLFSTVSCGKNNNSINPKIRAELEFFEKSSEITLASTDSTLISNVGYIAVFEDKLLIADEMSKKVVVFDTNGNYVKEISKVGDYPGGISYNLSGIAIEDKKIYILDQSKINVFDENLMFIEAIYTPDTISEFVVSSGKIIYLERINPNVSAEIRMFEKEKLKTIRKIPLKFPRTSSRENNFMLSFGNDNLLVFIQREFLLFLTNRNGTIEKKNLSIPERYVIPSEDFKGQFGSMNDLKKYFEKHKFSVVFNVFFQKNRIFIFWNDTIRNQTYVEIYDESLNHILSEIPIKADVSSLKYCDGEYFYLLKPPEMRDVEDFKNPTLVKYRFRHELMDSLTKNLPTRNE